MGFRCPNVIVNGERMPDTDEMAGISRLVYGEALVDAGVPR